MVIRVRLFAMLREHAGWREREIELPPDSSIEDAWSALVGLVPGVAASRDSVRFARNRQYAAADERLADGDELVLIPPVAGGESVLRRCEITPDPIGDELLAELRRTVPTPADGAFVLFAGQTRETAGTPAPGEEAEAARYEGERVVGLEYETFDEMAIDVLEAIAAEIETRFAVRRLAI
ncbi:MAG TPA: MoaD/ThiS family protein, partial [Candidatus Limnocylindrales bacterium]|nr:MoaD/ThiS family protein [Candidatus Limnocylindrales bacterium]